jgi:putative Holliday junction resolvase
MAGPRVLALDLGTRRIGVAVSDARRTLASPRPAVQRRDPDTDRQALLALVDETEAGTVVVGLPRSLDGGLGPAAKTALAEVEALRQALGDRDVVVDTLDERFTTVTAATRLRESGKRGAEARQSVDSAAAAVLLQAWLDARD